MSKAKNMSQFESMWTTQQTFRRNKHYYDALKVNKFQHYNEQKRRQPVALEKNKNFQRISQKFQSAKKQLENKVEEDIERYKFRMSFSNSININPETQISKNLDHSPQKSPRNIRGVPHDKFLSRQSLHSLKNKPCLDQRQFTNFYITKNDLSQTPKLDNYSPRNLSIALDHMTDLYYGSQKKYQELYFDKRTNSCLFNLKKQNQQKGRYFFIPQRPENNPSTQMKPESVAKSFSVATPFKQNKILHFYKINGRELPSNFDQRYNSPNKNYYKDEEGRLIKKQMSFTARRYKDDLLFRDLEQIKKSKKPYFNRDQICDERYFKQQKRLL